MKTILVPTEQNAGMASALDTALLFAKKLDSCIEGFPLRPAVADMVAMDPDAGMTMVAVKENDADMARQAEDLFRAFMEQNSVSRVADDAPLSSASLSWRWNAAAPSGHDFVGSYGRVFDLIVVPRPGEEWQSPSMVTLESALFESGRPVLIAPPKSPALDRDQCADCVEPQHRAGAHDGVCHAAAAAGQTRDDTDRRGFNRGRAEWRRDGAIAGNEWHSRGADHRIARQGQRR